MPSPLVISGTTPLKSCAGWRQARKSKFSRTTAPAITLGELRLGVLQAPSPEAASRRLSSYQLAQRFEALPVDGAVSDAWALLVSRLRAAGRKVPVNDSWIVATAIAHQVPIVTQDADYDTMPDVEVIRL